MWKSIDETLVRFWKYYNDTNLIYQWVCAMLTLVLLRNTDLEIQVRGQWDLQGDITILVMTMWSPPSSGGARETTMEMEGDRGNRAKARFSSERGISRRYRVKPYVPQIRRPYFNNSHLTQLSQLLHPDRKATWSECASTLEIVFALKFRKNEFNFVTFSRKYFILSSRLRNHIGFTQSRNSRGSFALTVNLREHTKS